MICLAKYGVTFLYFLILICEEAAYLGISWEEKKESRLGMENEKSLQRLIRERNDDQELYQQ